QTGSSSNYESLVASALGTAGSGNDGGVSGGADASTPADAGPPTASRWVAESSRNLVSSTSKDDSGAPPSLGSIFRSSCGEKGTEAHVVCSTFSDAGPAEEPDAGASDPDAGGV